MTPFAASFFLLSATRAWAMRTSRRRLCSLCGGERARALVSPITINILVCARCIAREGLSNELFRARFYYNNGRFYFAECVRNGPLKVTLFIHAFHTHFADIAGDILENST